MTDHQSDLWELSPEKLIIWALRSCVLNNQCSGLYKLLFDWFGHDAEIIFHNAQLLVWANKNGADIDKRFLPVICDSYRKEEVILLKAITNLVKDSNYDCSIEANILAGNFAEFAIHSIREIAEIAQRIERIMSPANQANFA